MTRKWNLPLTYQQKIQPVIDGKIRQTIRTGRKFNVGDLVRFYVWEGRPYRSKRKTVTEYAEIDYCNNITINHDGITSDIRTAFGLRYLKWNELDFLAKCDGIIPPTGEELKKVLAEKNKIPASGIEAQVVRW
jgi:hypothetical protein